MSPVEHLTSSGSSHSQMIVKTLFLSLTLVLFLGLYLHFGQVNISVLQAIEDWWFGRDSIDAMVLVQIRLPRAVLAVAVGAVLAMAGAAMQGLLRNPLAEPGLLGVSNGAALGAVLVLYFGLATGAAWYWLPAAAIAGALLSLTAVYVIAGIRTSILTLILAGVAVNAIASSLIALALNFAPNLFAVQEIVFWLMGSLANRSTHHLAIALPFMILGVILVVGRYRFLDALSLGEDSAQSLGFSLGYNRIVLLLGVALMVGSAVAVSGSIGFVGLVIPHIIRPWVNFRPAPLLVLSALAGANLVVLADLCVRLLSGVTELKLGVLTAIIGGPYFLYLIVSRRQRWV